MSRAWEPLSPPAQQDHHDLSLSCEIHSVSRTGVDAKLLHAPTDRVGVPEVAQAEPGNALADAVPTCSISKPTEPLCERLAAVRAGVDPDILLGRHAGNVA